METLTDHGRCCFVWFLGYQPLTDGICDNVLDVIDGIAGETVIELTQEEKRINSLSAKSVLAGEKLIATYSISILE